MPHTDHTQLIAYLKPGTILSHSEATEALDILRGIVSERDAAVFALSKLIESHPEICCCAGCNLLRHGK